MVRLLWAGICGTLGLSWFTLESVTGRLESGTSAETQVLWLILCPICAVGAMVHARFTSTEYNYRQACMTGLGTTVFSALALVLVWVLINTLLMPDYADVVLHGVEQKSRAFGENEMQTEQRVAMARMVFKAPTIYIVGFVIPLVVGVVASAISAIGLRKPKPQAT